MKTSLGVVFLLCCTLFIFTMCNSKIESVDMGLSVEWATCNIGSETPEDYGEYYAWGETETKYNYNWSEYKWVSMDKYNTDKEYGPVDNKVVLDEEDDVVTKKLGEKWRMPTYADWEELMDPNNCSWNWTSINGVDGFRITSKITGNSIFLPAAGLHAENEVRARGEQGSYWSSSLYEEYPEHAQTASFLSDDRTMDYVVSRCYGLPIRPVRSVPKKARKVSDNAFEAVDLGLSVNWASCNIGASRPEEYGDYYSWGETSTNSEGNNPNNYKWGDATRYVTKYVTQDIFGYIDIDNLTILEKQDDVASQNLGGKWRMPTDDEWTELRVKCKWTWTKKSGVHGYKVTSKKTGKSIFLPAGGYRFSGNIANSDLYGYYWSSSLEKNNHFNAWCVFFNSEKVERDSHERYMGQSVRPVQFKDLSNAVDMGLSVKWASCNIGASRPEEYGEYYAWGETTVKTDYSISTYKWCNGTYLSMTKYCTKKDYGTVDKKKTLEAADDIATRELGGNWHIPTDAEWKELRKKCVWEWTTSSGVKGYKITSKKTGNSIFLPAAGCCSNETLVYDDQGHYWSSSLNTDGPNNAWCVEFQSWIYDRYDAFRDYGYSIRPVTKE